MKEPLASVVIPVGTDSESLGQCLDKVARQDFESKEVIIVCDPRVGDLASLPRGSRQFRVIKERKPCTVARLVNSGMRAARGQFKILLMPHCIPVGDGWITSMIKPFEDDQVGVVVSQCFALDRTGPGLPARLLDSIDPQQRRSTKPGLSRQQVVSHLCDAYRASLLADIRYFEANDLASAGEAIDVSIKIADAGYSIVLSDAAVAAYNVPESRRRLLDVMLKAFEYGYTDAVLDRLHDLRWLNAGVLAGALLSLCLLPVAALSLPTAMILSLVLFAWGGFLALSLPLLRWECPVAVLNFAVYLTIILLIRQDWWPSFFGKAIHPAVIRQWCWLAALAGSYLLLVLHASLRGALRTCRRPRGVRYAVPVLFLSMPWWLLAGLGYLRGRLLRRAKSQ